MHVDGFDSELHETRIQYKNLNMHTHSLSSKGYSTSRNKGPFIIYDGGWAGKKGGGS